MIYALLADLVVVVHLLFILFVVGGEVLILLGGVRGWRWVRNVVFRTIHVAAIAVVAVNTVVGILCPLTVWETALRRRAGQSVQEDVSFVARLVQSVIYHDLPPWVFATAYVAFALLVVATLFLVPPRRKAST